MGEDNTNDRPDGSPGMTNDAVFADTMLSALPSVAVPAALEARILADFDVQAARPRLAPSRLMQRWRDAVWPGAPLWKPASIFALSLAIGLAVGSLVPSSDFMRDSSDQVQSQTTDTAPAFAVAGEL